MNADLLLLKRVEVVELEGVTEGTGGIVGFLRPLPHRPPPDHAPTTPELYRLSQLEEYLPGLFQAGWGLATGSGLIRSCPIAPIVAGSAPVQ